MSNNTYNLDQYYLSNANFHQFWKDAYQNIVWNDNNLISLYVHYPWCRSLCDYCIFNSYNYNKTDKSLINSYENATVNLIQSMDDIISSRDIYEIYFGGGTPSLWSFENESKIPKVITSYDKIKRRITEVHPFDLTKERIDFIVNDMKFNIVSIGIQSFDYDSNISQHRIPADIEKLSEAVKELRANGVYINMDIVAMFNGDDESNWDIYKRDLEIAAEIFHPDTLSTSPNYKSSDYYGISIKFREILRDFINQYPEYQSDYGNLIYSLNYEDIINFNGATYKFHLEDYANHMISKPIISDDKALHESLNNDIVIGFGGYKDARAISRTPDNITIRSFYQPIDDDFTHVLTKEDVFDYMNTTNDSDIYSKIVQIGNYQIPPPMRRDS